MPELRYFKLADDHPGRLDIHGNPAPLNNIGINILVPVEVREENGKPVVTEEVRTLRILPQPSIGSLPARIVPDTQIVEIRDLRVVAGLIQMGGFEEIDAPTPAALKKAREHTAAHRAMAKGEPLAEIQDAGEAGKEG